MAVNRQTVYYIFDIHFYSRPIFACSMELFSDRFFDQVWGMTLPLLLIKDFSYWPKIWWDDAQ